MDNNDEVALPEKFLDGLADIPSHPQSLYTGIRRRIDRKIVMVRSVWAVAASLIIMVAAFQASHLLRPQNGTITEAAEELSGVSNYINSDVYKENDNSYAYYEETLYQE